MSQGFRKGSKIPEPSDTTGITPPTRIDQHRNERRTQQIAHLHQEFQDLKKKIKEVQNKNEKIIQKIHKAYNFKKKSAYTQSYIGTGEESPVIHYDNRYEHGFEAAMSVDGQSNKSDKSQKQLKLQKRSTELGLRKGARNSQKNNYSVEYGRNDENIQQQSQRNLFHPQQMRHTMGQMPPMYQPVGGSFTTVGSQNRLEKKLVDELSQQKQQLEQQLNEREAELKFMQLEVRNTAKNMKAVVEENMWQFYENVMQKNLAMIEKTLKKYEQKLKNVKKLTLLMKDRQQDKKSSRLLEYGRQRRSQSKSRKNSPPRESPGFSQTQNSFHSRESRIVSREELKDDSKSRSRLAAAQQQKNKRQFEDIVSKYEQIVREQKAEIEKFEKVSKTKERQCYELKMRVEIIQKRLAEYEGQQKERRGSQSIDDDSRQLRKYPTESDLLSSINVEQNSAIIHLQQELSKLEQRSQELQLISNQKSTQISNLQNLLAVAENKQKMLHSQYQEGVAKVKTRYLQQEQKYKKEFERLLNDKNSELAGVKNMLATTEKKFLEKQCEFFALESRLKKMQGVVGNKDRKIEELQKIVNENCPTDRSLLLSASQTGENPSNSDAIKKLKEEIDSLQLKMEESKNQIFTLTKKNTYFKSRNEQIEQINNQLRKELQSLHIENEQLKINVNMNNISAVMKEAEDNSQDEEHLSKSFEEIESEASRRASSAADLEGMTAKMAELTREKEQWYSKYQKLKAGNLEKQSQNIKHKSEISFLQKQNADLQQVVAKLKSENQTIRRDNKQTLSKIQQLENQIESQRQDFKAQLNDIERRWLQYEEELKNPNLMQGDRSQKSSIVSYSTNRMAHSRIDTMNSHNQFLTLKLKETEAELQAQKLMEQKIIDEYQNIIEEYKIDIRNKNEQITAMKEQNEDLRLKVANMGMRLEANKSENAAGGTKKQQKNQLMERIEELENELKEAKEINNKLTDMEAQLFDQIKIKEEERGQLYQQLRKKQARIQELQEINEVHAEHVQPYPNNLSHSTYKRESIKSQSSLKYSSHSHALRKSHMLSSGKANNNSQERIFDLELSEAGSQFYEQPSQISNISQFFEKEELPYEKIKIKRHDQVKLFEKTASYIKSLKKAIEQKNKKIKLLQKKIQSLKSSQLVRKQLGLNIDIKEDRLISNDRLQAEDTFKDYESVQLDCKRGGQLRRFKQLEHDTQLVMEENTLLIQQIETLEEELLKAEEQENNLVRIKDLYKQQIKKLIKKNEEQTKAFEQELKNQRKRVEESQSVHNIQAIKQLFAKIVQVSGITFSQQNLNAKKKQEKRKQLEQYVKVMSNILKLDKKTKDSLIHAIHK